jgi:hypothetical protein
MTIRFGNEGVLASKQKRMKTLGLGLLAAVMVAASLILAANTPAHATTTFTVNNASDFGDVNVGDGVCSGSTINEECTLRAAIQEANATSGVDTIEFGIPGSGVKTISPNSGLPEITDQVTIDGYTQPGSSPNTLPKGTNARLKIELNGINAGAGVDGLRIGSGGSGSDVRGLVINRFGSEGISILAGSDSVVIEGNFIGTDPTGTLDRGNTARGVAVIDASINTVGGKSPAARNVISGNDSDGVGIFSAETSIVEGNLVGTKKDGTTALANSFAGVFIFNGSNNSVSSNTIGFNGSLGVLIVTDDDPNASNGNLVLGNSIFSNAGLGIDLSGGTENAAGVTANDPKDPDSGPNTLQNFSVLTSARTVSGKTTIKGRLNSTPNKRFSVQFFSNPSGNEGKRFVGQKGVTTDGSGNATFSFSPAQPVGVGQTITATATPSGLGGSTSELSAPRKVTS